MVESAVATPPTVAAVSVGAAKHTTKTKDKATKNEEDDDDEEDDQASGKAKSKDDDDEDDGEDDEDSDNADAVNASSAKPVSAVLKAGTSAAEKPKLEWSMEPNGP